MIQIILCDGQIVYIVYFNYIILSYYIFFYNNFIVEIEIEIWNIILVGMLSLLLNLGMNGVDGIKMRTSKK